MSKDGLPTVKDGELFGDVLKQPIVVRYHGVDTQTVEGAALVAARAGEVNRFVAKGRQAYSLSGRTHLTVRGQITDGDARYTNQFGNEIVDVRVNTPKPSENPVKIKKYWDWAVINIVVPDAEQVSMSGVAFLIPQPSIVPPGVAADHIEDVEADDGVALAYPLSENATQDDPDTSTRISSLRLDLRKFRGWSAVGIDLYGAVVSTDYPEIPYRYRRVQTSNVDTKNLLGSALYVHSDSEVVPGDQWDPNAYTFYDMTGGTYGVLVDLNVDLSSVLVADAPLTPNLTSFGYDQFKQEYIYDAASGLVTTWTNHNVYFGVPEGGVNPPWNVGETYEVHDYRNVQTFDIVLDTVPGEPDPITRDCEVRVSMFVSTPHWSVTSQPDPGDGFIPARWDDRITGRSAGVVVGTVTMTGDITSPVDIEHHYGRPYLGRVTIDLEYGGAGFKPA